MDKPVLTNIEKRIAKINFRAADTAVEGDTDRVEMYAAKFGSTSVDLGGFLETIEPGAFAEALKISDVRALVNHNENRVLARNVSGTMELREDETGLWAGFSLPNTTYAADLKESMKRGDITQCSFAFEVEEDEWLYVRPTDSERGQWTRTIKKVKELYDVSIVTYPAYPETEAGLRRRPAPDEKQVELPENESDAWLDYIDACRQ